MKSKILRTSFLAMGLASALSLNPAQAAGSAADAVEPADAYVRAVPPVSQTSAAFMTLKNSGAEDYALVGASSPAAQIVELHTHIKGENGMHQMREVERIDVPAGGQTALQPGGFHVMLINLNGPLEPGNSVELTLVYDDGSEETLTAPIKSVAETMMMPTGKCGGGKCGAGGKCGGGK